MLEERSKIFSAYLRPWTLVQDESSCHVPLIVDLSKTQTQLEGGDENGISFRSAWKNYLTRVPPTAVNQIRNFMLACMSEGKTHHDEEDEQGYHRDTRLYCKLALQEVREALSFQAEKNGFVKNRGE